MAAAAMTAAPPKSHHWVTADCRPLSPLLPPAAPLPGAAAGGKR
eukprot:CAMPEP_0206414008 /NCGR_PEP_ID=MMETSP0294-20121207/35079_1 /ASSEMBLY_ACC=CAM_ASM_000327 /TAXON_ID=39354 /ORGANISM="Heterosigma akashiwo, Strain CCMP2393" /LENGTH=43 /DNA_ID= /DNA_START= /DNA_END= /DNA_ORIENTATION=